MAMSRSKGMTVAAARALALALPLAEEVDHWGKPSFRVKGKIFATLQPQDETAVLKTSPEERDAMCEAFPTAFEAIAWGTQSWTRVFLRRVQPRLFAQLLESAWGRVAPKKALTKPASRAPSPSKRRAASRK